MRQCVNARMTSTMSLFARDVHRTTLIDRARPMEDDDYKSPRTSPVPSSLRRRLTSAQSSSLSSLRSTTTQSS